jgi:hypothetical protein
VALLSKAQIDAVDDTRWRDVPVPEWGEDAEVRVRALTGSERDRYEGLAVVTGPNGSIQRRLPADARSQLLVMCLVDAEGNRLYADKDVKALAKKDSVVISRLFEVAKDLAALGKESVEEKKGNSEAAQSGSSTSD